jgi:hypothetical protein
LEAWGSARDWYGPDPYEGMNSPLLASLGRTPLSRRVLIQLVRRSPMDLRKPLRIAPVHNPATIAHLLSAYTRLGVLGPAARDARVRWAADLLDSLRRPEFDEPCWSYHFDVETRFFFYSAKTPNTIATGFAGLALLEAYDATGDERLLELAFGAGRFFLEHIPQVPAADAGLEAEGAFFGYFPGDRSPIHNASLLAASLLAELSVRGGPARFSEQAAEAAARAAEFAVSLQRPDGSWPYAETPAGDWVDNFHTGYNLDALGRIAAALAGPSNSAEARKAAAGAAAARERGLPLYARDLFEPNGAPRFLDDSLYPIDGQCVAQALTTFSLASELDPEWLVPAWRTFRWGAERMRRHDGAFYFQRRRLWVNPAPHVRWVQAPMLDALARLDAATKVALAREEER